MRQSILIERIDGQVIDAFYAEADDPRPPEEAPLVIFVHGFPPCSKNSSGVFDAAIEELLLARINSLRFEFTGSGKSSESDHHINFEEITKDFDTVFAWAKKHGYQSLAFVTEGLGAMFTFMNLPNNTRYCVCLWPVLDAKFALINHFDIKDHKAELETDGKYTLNDAEIVVSGQLVDDLMNADFNTVMKQDVRAPVFIIHGNNDDVVPVSQVDIAREHLFSPRLDITIIEEGEQGLTRENHKTACTQHIRSVAKNYIGAFKSPKKQSH